MLHSSDRDRTLILVGFSETSDPNGNWHFYTIDGNPFDINIFSDYPMVAITKDKFYFTVNAVDVDSTWQDGFVETYIWEIDKFSGYNGDSLEAVMYNEILFGGQPIRNLCPITPANEGLLDKQYFLSNRNFAVENDTFFLVTLDNGLVDVRTLIADTPYGVPPNAVQNNSLTLQTNDARVLDAFYLDGKVQFVNNCVNPVNGFASIYHGRIADIENSNSVSGDVIAYGDLELGYPDISYAGVQPGEDHSIIVVSHVGEGRFPGISALEYDGSTYSELVTLHEGTGVINQIGGSLQRWGDYSGNQRIYNLPGACWTVSSFGRSNREYGVGINELSRSDINVSSRDVQHIPHKIYPNPVSDWVEIEFEIPSRSLITINLFDLRGQGIREIVTTTPKKTGQATFRFATDHLSSGTYIISASSEEGILFSDRIIISN
ncbi:MAG: T9SS type A sorting domain-containing protein, partial [Saprospiraceae bacterium]|nr:T9SS type A sorting domain-containing protein [Saprospiraceae bacterium]